VQGQPEPTAAQEVVQVLAALSDVNRYRIVVLLANRASG
jgi:hypothetical protein